MSLAAKLLSASGGGVDKLYVDDVFSAYTYTGNGSTQTITNGIDLAGKGGLVWTKQRSSTQPHILIDTARGANKWLSSNNTDAQYDITNSLTFAGDGYSIPNSYGGLNSSTFTYVSHTFRRSPKFFDIVTYTGNGVAGRQIPHALGIAPGMVIVKQLDTARSWAVSHRSLAGSSYALMLESTSAQVNTSPVWFGVHTETHFIVGNDNVANRNGGSYVAYLFAHDSSADGIVQCGSFTTDGSGNATVNLGWEPQFFMSKTSSAVGGWTMLDTARGLTTGSAGVTLFANTSAAEGLANQFYITATGMNFGGAPSTTYIYLAIRRPNKPPTLGTQVYNAIARTGTGAAATVTGVGFAPDLVMSKERSATGFNGHIQDRLRGASGVPTAVATDLSMDQTSAESAQNQALASFNMDGVTLGTGNQWNFSGATFVNHFFKRAPGVFDIVAYTGTGVAKTEAHGLGVVPELMIVKSRSAANSWGVYDSFNGPLGVTAVNQTWAWAGNASMFGTAPTASVFYVGGAGSGMTNTAATTYVAYLFATKAGVSKVGSYTGNGTSQTIDCGFTTGARFVMVKATSTTGNWTVIDTARGLVAGSDPYLALNTTAAEVTGEDCVDPVSSGFIVNTTTAALNTNGVSYLFLAFA